MRELRSPSTRQGGNRNSDDQDIVRKSCLRHRVSNCYGACLGLHCPWREVVEGKEKTKREILQIFVSVSSRKFGVSRFRTFNIHRPSIRDYPEIRCETSRRFSP